MRTAGNYHWLKRRQTVAAWLPWWSLVLAWLFAVGGGASTWAAEGGADRAVIADLPVVELPAAKSGNEVLVVFLSGDGGWADLDKSVGEALQKQGVATVGFDCLKYFWKKREPAEVARTMETVIRYYLRIWEKKRVVLAGFSFGACWLPFLVNRMPADIASTIQFCVLLGPGDFVNVEIHLFDYISDVRRAGALEVLPEAKKIRKPLLCVYGTKEKEAICPALKGDQVQVLALPGDHHYNYQYAPVIKAILDKMATSP